MASDDKLQLIYYYGISEVARGYPNDTQNLETIKRLNDTTHFYMTFAINHLISKFRYPNHWNFYQTNNWIQGFDRAWRKVLNNYNGNNNEYGNCGCEQIKMIMVVLLCVGQKQNLNQVIWS